MTFASFAAACAALASTRSRNRKVRAAAAFLRGLPDSGETEAAARFLAGAALPATGPRALDVGWSVASRAALAVVSFDDVLLGASVRATGDAAEAVAKLLEAAPARAASQRTLAGFGGPAPPRLPLVTCRDLAAFFAALASARGPARKADLLADAMRSLSPAEIRYFLALALGGDLRTGFGEPLVEEAVAQAFARPLASVRLAAMLLGDVGEAAALAREDRLDAARLRPLHPLRFMLASAIDDPPADPAVYLVEDKYDGVRTQLHKVGDRVALFSRTLDDVTARFPEVAEAALRLPADCVLDGEVVAWADGRALPFAALQRRLGRSEVQASLRAEVPVRFVAYDVLYLDGEETFREPLVARRARLAALLPDLAPGAIELSPAETLGSAGAVEAAFEAARVAGNEGLMLKRLDSAYELGKRGKAWLKMKKAYATLDVVVTAAQQGHGRRAGLLSDYTFAVRGPGGVLLNVGKAYSGLTDEEVRDLTDRFRRLTRERHGGTHVVRPEVVLEVAFDAVQPSARHRSGFALRFPRIVRIRDDKTVEDIDTLDRVAELARTGAHSAPPPGDAEA